VAHSRPLPLFPRSERSPVSGMGQIRYRSPILGTLFSFQNSRDPSQNPIDCVLLALASMLALLLKTKTFNSGVLRGWSTDAWLHAEITAVNCRALERQSSLASSPSYIPLTKTINSLYFFPTARQLANQTQTITLSGIANKPGIVISTTPARGGPGASRATVFPMDPETGISGSAGNVKMKLTLFLTGPHSHLLPTEMITMDKRE